MARESLLIASTLLKKMAESLGKVPVLGSTLQSIKRGTSTEVDYLNGEIVNLGNKMGIPTPENSLLVELVHHVEITRKFLTVDEFTQRLS
jgi:2-dehydropantoate 2-reductase